MFAEATIYSSPLQKAIDRHPLTMTPDTLLFDVLQVISQLQNSCLLPNLSISKNQVYPSILLNPINTKCVLVVENKPVQETPKQNIQVSLLGILTTTDIVKLISAGKVNNLESLSKKIYLGEVMKSNIITLKESEDQDLFTALSLFRKYKISHIPVLDRKNQIVGVVTPEKIRQVLQPSNILRLRRVNEIKNDCVTVTISATESLLQVSKLMSEYKVNNVIITQKKKLKTQNKKIEEPIGIVTQDDILQAYFLNMDLAKIPVKTIMDTELNFVKSTNSLWDAQKKMLQEQVQVLLVCSQQGELLGTVNQANLLQVVDPTVMFGLVKKLRADVNQLQAEKLELLRSRNAELEKEVQARTAEIQEQLERDRLLAKIALRIHQSLNLNEIINAAVSEVQQLLTADRVVLFQVKSSKVTKIVAESVVHNCSSWMDNQAIDDYLISNLKVKKNKTYAVADIDQTDLPIEEIRSLKEKQVKAFLIVPICLDGPLWGIMCTQECSGTRQWQASEIDLLKQLGTQLAIAIQQAQLYQQVRILNTDLERQVQERTIELEEKVKELEQLNILKDDFLSTVSHELRTPLSNMKMAIHMLKIFPVPEKVQQYLKILDTECKREIELISDLLDLQRLEAGQESIALETINLNTLLPTILEPFKSRAKERKQILNSKYPKQLPSIYSNNNSLGRILAELLNNACKYTQDGGEIMFLVEKKDKKSSKKSLSETPSYIKFIVSNPSQIPESELPKIFNKFYRVPNADPWKQGGTGLGLALVKKLVEQLNGNMIASSSNGWTTFTVELPM